MTETVFTSPRRVQPEFEKNYEQWCYGWLSIALSLSLCARKQASKRVSSTSTPAAAKTTADTTGGHMSAVSTTIYASRRSQTVRTVE